MTAPDVTAAHYAWFGGSLLASTAFVFLTSPRRRRVIGNGRFMAAWVLIAGTALFAAVCVRGGYSLAFKEGGMNGVLAQMAGTGIGLIFLVLVRIGLLLFPPSAWLLKEWRRANREASPLARVFKSSAD